MALPVKITIQTNINSKINIYRGKSKQLKNSVDVAAKSLANVAYQEISTLLRKPNLSNPRGILLRSLLPRSIEQSNGRQARYSIYSVLNYAPEIDQRIGLPRQKAVQGSLKTWLETVNPTLATFKKITIGLGLNPNSVYSKFPNGIQFIKKGAEAARQVSRNVISKQLKNIVK